MTNKNEKQTSKEKRIIAMIEEWFNHRTMLSKTDFEMLNKFYWGIKR